MWEVLSDSPRKMSMNDMNFAKRKDDVSKGVMLQPYWNSFTFD